MGLFRSRGRKVELTWEDAAYVARWLGGILDDHRSVMAPEDISRIESILTKLPGRRYWMD